MTVGHYDMALHHSYNWGGEKRRFDINTDILFIFLVITNTTDKQNIIIQSNTWEVISKPTSSMELVFSAVPIATLTWVQLAVQSVLPIKTFALACGWNGNWEPRSCPLQNTSGVPLSRAVTPRLSTKSTKIWTCHLLLTRLRWWHESKHLVDADLIKPSTKWIRKCQAGLV